MSSKFISDNPIASIFEVKGACRDLGTPVNCNVSFDGSNIPLKFGPFGHREFEPNADIAGIGIFVALLVNASIVIAHAIYSALSDPRNRNSEALYTSLLSVSDVLLITIVAYIVNFMALGKCVMSTYHFYVALDTILIACSAIIAILLTSRQRRTVTLVLRWISTLIILILLGLFIVAQLLKHRDTLFPEQLPPDRGTRNDSALLLPASCFFDLDLENHESPYAPNHPNINDLRLDRIGQPVKVKFIPQIWFYFFLLTVFLTGPFVRCFCKFSYEIGYNYQIAMILKSKRVVPALELLFICIPSSVYCAWHIYQLREWTKASGWMKDGSEDEPNTIGQLLPILAIGLVGLSFFDNKSSEKKFDQLLHRVKYARRRGFSKV